ncbi:MAG: tetratricopeptide repeat protein [Hyphomicrobium sp.]
MIVLQPTLFRIALVVSISVLSFWDAQAYLSKRAKTSKDVGPALATCDRKPKGSEAWKECLGNARVEMSDAELFYAGYWLAKSGQYETALTYLYLTRNKNEKVLTYIGYATRKLGDVEKAIPYYAEALTKNPNYVVARAYLGEAYLTRGKPNLAKGQLQEIKERCGVSCPSYKDLELHISDYLSAHG